MSGHIQEWTVSGRNVIREAILSEATQVLEIICHSKETAELFRNLIKNCKLSYNISIREQAGSKRDKVRDRHGGRVDAKDQGCRARVLFRNFFSIQDLETYKDSDYIILDHIQDPQNFGALLRSAAAFNIPNVVIPNARACPLTANAIEVSAGYAFHQRFFEVANLGQTLDRLAELGYWIYGADQKAETSAVEFQFLHPLALVLGSEGKGISEGLRKRIHQIIRISMSHRVESINVSAAGAVLMALVYNSATR